MIKKMFLFLTALSIMVSCDGKITANLFLRDLIDAEADKENIIFTSAVLGIESPGEDSKQKVIDFIKANFREATNFRSESIGYDNYLIADIKIPIKHKDTSKPKDMEDIFYIITEEKDETLYLGFGLNKNVFEKIKNYVSEEFWQTMDIKDWSLRIIFNNDTRDEYDLTVNCCFINDYPYPFSHTLKFNPRDNLNIYIPDVLRDYCYDNKETFFSTLKQNKKISNKF